MTGKRRARGKRRAPTREAKGKRPATQPGRMNFWGWRKKATPPRECHQHADCGDEKKFCCNATTQLCISVDSPRGREECKLTRGGQDIRRMREGAKYCGIYPDVWEKKPGQVGFSKYALQLLHAAGIERSMSCDKAEGDRWYQRVLSYLVHPRSPVHRLLVVWQLGTGKTIGMLRVLDNYFDDQRPKLLLFPTEAVADNFYGELATTPGRYQDWLRRRPELGPWPAERADMGVQQLVELEALRARYIEKARELLSLWPVPVASNAYSGLPAPLRAFSYAQAGSAGGTGSLVQNKMLNWPPAGRPGYVARLANGNRDVMRSMVILCDEPFRLSIWAVVPPWRMGRQRRTTSSGRPLAQTSVPAVNDWRRQRRASSCCSRRPPCSLVTVAWKKLSEYSRWHRETRTLREARRAMCPGSCSARLRSLPW